MPPCADQPMLLQSYEPSNSSLECAPCSACLPHLPAPAASCLPRHALAPAASCCLLPIPSWPSAAGLANPVRLPKLLYDTWGGAGKQNGLVGVSYANKWVGIRDRSVLVSGCRDSQPLKKVEKVVFFSKRDEGVCSASCCAIREKNKCSGVHQAGAGAYREGGDGEGCLEALPPNPARPAGRPCNWPETRGQGCWAGGWPTHAKGKRDGRREQMKEKGFFICICVRKGKAVGVVQSRIRIVHRGRAAGPPSTSKLAGT